MSWPINFSISSPTFVGKAGNLPSILAFGTDQSWIGVIVKNIRSTPMVENIPIPQGSGLTISHVILNDGDQVEFTVDDDRAITWPLTGGIVVLVNPQPNGSVGTTETFQVLNNNYNIAAKSVGERVITAVRYSLISPVQM